MSLRKVTLAVLAGAAILAAVPASAQYYDPYRPAPPRYDYDYDRRPPPPPRYDDDYRRPPPPGYEYRRRGYDDDGYGPPRGPRAGGMCVTSRGSCPTPPITRGAPCRCDIPGFGEKRGVIQ